MVEFKSPTLSDYEKFAPFFFDEGEFSCEMNFISIYIWKTIYENKFYLDDKTLFFRSLSDDEGYVFSLPYGDMEYGMNLIFDYCKEKGIKIIGDIPFYVSFDSADVWENPEVFRLGRDMTPVQVAGVPPDIFSKEGQLWGNPIYDWDLQKKTNYLWWRKRLIHSLSLYDVLRIDHFRAFASWRHLPCLFSKCNNKNLHRKNQFFTN